METRVTEELFDLSDEYEAMLMEGVRLSGEGMAFFQEGRLSLLQERARNHGRIERILDFGCGLGYTSARLREIFPGAEVTGVDTSDKVLAAARERNGGAGMTYRNVTSMQDQAAGFDLCYVNGVFHHIAPAQRAGTVEWIRGLLRPGGVLALFENNPWNFGARMVMARIPFDRDAQMLSPRETANLMRRSGFTIAGIDSLFFFPRALKALRAAEPYLSWTRLGAQYLVRGVRA